MGKLTADGDDLAEQVAEADLAAVNATTATIVPVGRFNVTITGVFTGSLIVERSFDAGVTWVGCASAGAVVVFTTPASEQLTHSGEAGVLYRFRMVAWTSGAARARISQ